MRDHNETIEMTVDQDTATRRGHAWNLWADRSGVFDPGVVFADPVAYLEGLGIDARLIETEADPLAPAA